MLTLKQRQNQIYLRLSLLALLISFTLTALAISLKKDTIEIDLAHQARTALAQEHLPFVNVHFMGRDAILSGVLSDPSQLEPIINTVQQVDGVRTVASQLLTVNEPVTVTNSTESASLDTKPTGLHQPKREHAVEQFDLSAVAFIPTQTTLTPESYPILDQLVELLKQHPETNIEISAHTDNNGTVLGQNAMTQAKAEAVLQYLVEKGIDIKRLRAKGYGATRPIASNGEPIGRKQNQRIEISVIS